MSFHIGDLILCTFKPHWHSINVTSFSTILYCRNSENWSIVLGNSVVFSHEYTQTMVYILKHDPIGSSKIRTRDLSVSSLTRCHLNYRASVLDTFFWIKFTILLISNCNIFGELKKVYQCYFFAFSFETFVCSILMSLPTRIYFVLTFLTNLSHISLSESLESTITFTWEFLSTVNINVWYKPKQSYHSWNLVKNSFYKLKSDRNTLFKMFPSFNLLKNS